MRRQARPLRRRRATGSERVARLLSAGLLRIGVLVVVAGLAAVGFAAPARADTGASGASIVGYTASVQALGIQYAFNIPGLVPLPGDNLIEDDVPFARTNVTQGPVINALGAPYYPGDILANFGGLLSEFAPPSAPASPDDPLLAMADYPPTPSHGSSASFGGTPPAGSPVAPNVFSATADASATGSTVTATLSDLAASPPTGTSSQVVSLGPPAATGRTHAGVGAPLGSAAKGSAASAPTGSVLDVGTLQVTNQLTVSGSQIGGVAGTVLKAIDVAGVLDISQIDSSASSTSDGTQGDPVASLHLLGVTVEGQPAYIDNQGVHVTGISVAPGGVTPQQAQSALGATFAQDGITVRLLDPKMTTNGAEGVADSGGLVVSFAHQFAVPFIPGEPQIPVPGLGNQGLPAGVYDATTSITLGWSTSDVQATVASSFGSANSLGLGGAGLGLGAPQVNGSGVVPFSGSTPLGSPPATSASPGEGGSVDQQSLGARASSRLPLGIPVPVGWVIVALIVCVIFAYPMLVAVRWQFLSGRGR